MKKLLLSLVAFFAMTSMVFAQGKADFSTLTANSSYAARKTTAGWSGTNCAVLQYGTGNSGTNFAFITSGEKALCMNGKTTAVGKITSPTLEGGIGTLTFSYGHAFSESNGVNITISVKQNGTEVASTKLVKNNSSVTKLAAYSFSYDFNVSGDFVLEILNNSPSQSTSNKDRVAIFDLVWTGCADDAPAKPYAPSFSLAEGTYYEAQSVELSCDTEGAAIYYTIDGTEPDATSIAYTEAIAVAETTTIKAVAIKDDVASNVATATYVIDAYTELENVAAFYAMGSTTGKAISFVNPLTVVYQQYNNLIVKDETGSMLIYGALSNKYINGDVIAGVKGTLGVYGGNKQVVPVEVPAATQGTPVEPKEVTMEELKDCAFLDYVKVEDVTVVAGTKDKNYTLSDGTTSYAAYNQFSITMPELAEGNIYDVTGFVSSYNGTAQLQPTEVVLDEIATGIEEVNAANAPVEYYNLQGVKVANPENGIFIKKQGAKATKVVM